MQRHSTLEPDQKTIMYLITIDSSLNRLHIAVMGVFDGVDSEAFLRELELSLAFELLGFTSQPNPLGVRERLRPTAELFD